MSGFPSRSVRTSPVAWLAMAAVLVAVLLLGSSETPTSGLGDDRAYALGAQMKCLQCVGESVAGSQAPIAVQMRAEIRKQMRAGRTDDEILSYFGERYGQEVLLNPPGRGVAGLVWVIPVVVIALGAVGVGFVFARSRRVRQERGATQLSEAQQERVAAERAAFRGDGSAGS